LGLLQEIITGATDGTKPVSELLRSMQVLAVRGGARDLQSWVKKERDGYGDYDVLPSYRGPFSVNPKAHLAGPFNSQIRNMELPRGAFPEEFYHLFEIRFYQRMAEMEDLIAKDVNKLHMPWPADAVALANGLMNSGRIRLIEMHGLVSAWTPVGRAAMVRTVDAVRSRILDLALELEGVSPELGDVAGSTAEHKEEISAKFQMNITAHTVNVGETVFPNYGVVAVTTGDTGSLEKYLRALQVTDEAAIDELTRAVESGEVGDLQKEDSRLMKAMKRVGGLVGTASVNAGTSSGFQLVQKAVEGYLGLGA
jgi:hypothetical protein